MIDANNGLMHLFDFQYLTHYSRDVQFINFLLESVAHSALPYSYLK